MDTELSAASTPELVGLKKLDLIQNHYTEQRLIRVLAADGSQESLIINEKGIAGEILMNVSLGRYSLSVDETPLSASFNAAQFEELMEMRPGDHGDDAQFLIPDLDVVHHEVPRIG